MSTGARITATDTNRDSSEPAAVPFEKPLRTWAGRGSGAACDLCRQSIKAHEIEYEIELVPAEAARTLRFHFDCYRTWEAQNK